MKKVRAGIIGGAGYTGGELIRLLIHHPAVKIAFVNSRSNAGKKISTVHQDLAGDTDLQFSEQITGDADVLVLCVGHGEAQDFLQKNDIPGDIKIIDLSQDFRLHDQPVIRGRRFIYGLPELNKEKIATAQNVANPGCFATAIQLGLLPLAAAGVVNTVYTTGITGSTGAGQSLSATSHFSWRANNIQAYKTLTHQHLNEIYQSLHQLQATFPSLPAENEGIKFVPWRGDFTRGIFISSQVSCDLSAEDVKALYSRFYKDQPFVVLSDAPVSLKQVVNTNKAVIQLEKVGSTLVVHSAIDNLLKGASGQAVQNLNIMFGLEEAMGLKLKANYF